jgi:ABC-type antimicrobial peptide transport system permease subunit
MWVNHELSYDKFHKDKDKLYKIVNWQHYNNSTHAMPNLPGRLVDLIKEKIPEVKYATNYNAFGDRMLVNFENKKQYHKIKYADPDFLRMFSFPLVKGNSETALNDPYSMVLTEKAAKKLFGDKDPIGQIVKVNDKYNIKVTGVVKDLPSNSVFDFEFLLPFELYKKDNLYWKNWGSNYHYGYVKLDEHANPEQTREKLRTILQDHAEEDRKNTVGISPLTKCHLYNLDGSDNRIKTVRLFLIIALFILLIACFNFMNLSTARAAKRAKEIGLKKSLGASKFQLIWQFLGESILITFIAINFALIMVRLFIPEFNNLLQQELQINYTDWEFILGVLGVIVVTGLLAGAYPAFYLTSYNTILVLKGITQSGKKGNIFRKILVVVQFSLSVLLLIGTLVVALQTKFMQDMDLGLDKEDIIYVPLTGQLAEKRDVIKRELTADPSIETACFSSHLPMSVFSNGWGPTWEGKDPASKPLITFLRVDPDHLSTFKIELNEGKFYNQQTTSTDSNCIVINEKFAKLISNESVVGKTIQYGNQDLQIIGVTKDFHYTPVDRKIGPLMMYLDKNFNYLFVRHNPHNTSRAIEHIQKVCSKYNPEFPTETNFLDAMYAKLFQDEESTMAILKYFSLLAIIISCLGLFGLASFMAEERTKEIGVRKVLGASVGKLVSIFSREFTKWVLLSNLIAWPIAWYFLNKWLSNFAYRIDMPIWVFAAVAFLVLVIAFVTVGYQSWKSATRNPIKSLKYE